MHAEGGRVTQRSLFVRGKRIVNWDFHSAALLNPFSIARGRDHRDRIGPLIADRQSDSGSFDSSEFLSDKLLTLSGPAWTASVTQMLRKSRGASRPPSMFCDSMPLKGIALSMVHVGHHGNFDVVPLRTMSQNFVIVQACTD